MATDDAQNGAAVDLYLDERAKLFPSDAALASWRRHAYQGKAVIVYDIKEKIGLWPLWVLRGSL